jgi:DNA-binding CsgD family transcriptional regulator
METTRGLSQHLEPRDAYTYLCEQLSQCTSGTGRVVLINGGIASGKTQVQSEFLQHATESGVITLYAAGAPDETAIEAGVLEALLSSSTLPAEETAHIDEILLAAEEITEQTIREVCLILLRLARERPVVIGVDDLQFADDTSLRLLLQLQRRIRSTHLMLVLNHSGQLSQFTRHPHVDVVLTPLSADAIADLVPEADTATIHELSAGNPMLVSALIDDHHAGQVPGAIFAKAIRELLHRGHPQLVTVAGALAVSGQAGPDRVATIASVDAELAATLLASLTSSGLLTGGRFRHPAIAAAVRDGLSPATRAALHLRCAELKHHDDPADETIAAHLVAAGQVLGDWSIPLLANAAEHAVHHDDPAFATACLDLATSSARDEAGRRAIRRTLAGMLWRVNPSAAPEFTAAMLQEATAASADAVVVLRQAMWHGDRRLADRAFAVLHDADPRTEAELRLAYRWHFGAAEELPATSLGAINPWGHTASTLAQVWTRGGGDATTACAERILQNCRLSDTALEALSTAITALAFDDRGDRATEWCVSLSEDAARRGATTWQAMIDAVWSGITLRRGDVPSAVARAKSTLDMLDARSWGVAIGYPLTTLLIANTVTGAFKAAAEVLRHPVPEAMFDTVVGLRYLRARGHYYLATNRALAAVSDFEQVGRLMREWGIDYPALLPWRSDLAEANLRLGDPKVAAELARQQLDFSPDIDAYAHGASLRVLAFVGEPAWRVGMLRDAVEQFRASGDRLELGKTARTLAQLQQRRGPASRVLPAQKPATVPPAKPAAAKPAPKPVAAPATESTVLSASEVRVAQLAALGHTNRQIASALFITISTVEQHLTRVYRKLGVSGRSALPADLAEDLAPTVSN